MSSYLDPITSMLLVAVAFIIPTIFIIAIHQNCSLIPPPKQREFSSALANWARGRGLLYAPQKMHVISGVYNNRWFVIGTVNEENALRIRMSVRNLGHHSLQIFGDWLEQSDATAFVNRFRIYSSPSGLSEKLFEGSMCLREVLMRFPGLRSRLELFSDSKDLNHLYYSLLADLTEADTLEIIMASMHQFCEAFEQEIAHADKTGD